jgi:hypothetical protein
MMKQLAMMMVLVGGCGDSQIAADEPDAGAGSGSGSDAGAGTDLGWYKSGARIKMNVLNTPDGAKQFLGWHDTQLNDDCTFKKASDGVTRCLPNDMLPHLSAYSDSTCTMPAVFGYACNPAPKYVQAQTMTQVCGGMTTTYGTIWLRGAQITTAYVKNGSSCSLLALDSTLVAYAIGAEVPLSDFQSATSAVE